jgi:adenylate kinase family enzyme
MPRIVIFGNSGSGKSTLAREKADQLGCAHFDLDTVAWDEGRRPPTRRSLPASEAAIDSFLAAHEHWIVEGCYADLLALVVPRCDELIFLNPGVAVCQANCRDRPLEPHKYRSPAEQDANLAMLLAWVAEYPRRTDEFSLQAHRRLFDAFDGRKIEYTSNERGRA